MSQAVLRLVLGDQLSLDLSSLQGIAADKDWILMAEVAEEASYVPHHKKKLALVFAAMRHFAAVLQQKGWQVRYVKLDDPDNSGSLQSECKRALTDLGLSKIVVTMPGEYRLLQQVKSWPSELGCQVKCLSDKRFICPLSEFRAWAKDRKQLRMEYFYRLMRKQHQVLMQGDKPEGGKWNFDNSNRKALPKDINIPARLSFEPDEITCQVLTLVEQRFPDNFGRLSGFDYAVTREQALDVLEDFIQNRLPLFGDYQDAMQQGQPWLFHSHISFYLNLGLLQATEVIKGAEVAYHQGLAPLNAVEGFIRQILGWREYVRGLYWLKMPDYKQQNYLQAQRDLPDFFWHGDTQMNCLRQCVQETYDNAYAHHIQRLMVLGNFSLLAGLAPSQVNDWYLLVYADAYEWVELPNVSGMVLFADGGLLASKPYIASGSYINKMSDYCQHCHYQMKLKSGEQACPFNYLYWDFLHRHQQKLQGNPRLGMPYRTLNNMSAENSSSYNRTVYAFWAGWSGMKKSELPQKICPVCQRPFHWRKKWRNCWDEVKYCSQRCRGRRF